MEWITEQNRIYVQNAEQKILAEVLFPVHEGSVVNITRTFVDESLRGQGVAGQLMNALLKTLQETHRKAIPVCSYAVHWFETHSAAQDVLYENGAQSVSEPSL